MGLFNKEGWLGKLAGGLKKTKENIANKIDDLVKYYKEIDDDFFEELEMILVSADIGVSATDNILQDLKARLKAEKTGDVQLIHSYLRESIEEILLSCQSEENEEYPLLMLITGVNGVGKTTAIGKIANYYKNNGKTVMVAAADTFRAAAQEQLDLWAQKAGALIIRGTEGADPSSVVYDAIQSAKAKKIDVLICDTAGRLHNKKKSDVAMSFCEPRS